MSDPTRISQEHPGPGPAFHPDGSFDLSTPRLRLAACEAALANIALVPVAYNGRGAEFCRDEMQRQASDLTRQLRDARIAVRIRIARPRPSPRTLSSEFERETALDFEVDLEVGGIFFEGSITVHDPYGTASAPSGRWAPCRSEPHGWIHGPLMAGIQRARQLAGARADAVERALVLALSGLDWPKSGPRSLMSWSRPGDELLLELDL